MELFDTEGLELSEEEFEVTEVTTTELVPKDVIDVEGAEDDVVGVDVVGGEGVAEVADVGWTVVLVFDADSVLVELGEDRELEGEALLFLRPAEASSLSNLSSLGYGFSPWLGLFSDKVSIDSIPESSPC